MINPDVITFATTTALREAAAHYSASVIMPCFVSEVDGFAGAHLTEIPDGVSTLITDTPDSLAISVHDGAYRTRLFVNVDLRIPGEEVAAIVAPDFYDEHGKLDPIKGTMMRPIVRPLTETEGRELTMDLYSIISKVPASHRKN